MDKDVINEPVSQQNLKIRIPTPRVEETNDKDESKTKKVYCISYIFSCIFCCSNDDNI